MFVMYRAHFIRGGQTMFFENILKTSGFSMETLAQLCNVSVRTIRDWKLEKYRAEYDAVIFLSKKWN